MGYEAFVRDHFAAAKGLLEKSMQDYASGGATIGSSQDSLSKDKGEETEGPSEGFKIMLKQLRPGIVAALESCATEKRAA
mmetsp:Transcript_11971/g.30348  ORF Transcript_11971/g.30348 Transcript_11971/m.30348 type:complete len:80 (-) Transcript_11971:545-784(-)